MASQISVTITGPAFSSLIFENVRCLCDQEGFLVGEVMSHVTDTISDSQIHGEKTETIISVNSLMPIPYSVSLYNGVGRIDRENLRSFLKDRAKEITGWYSFHRNASLVPHLRARVLHKELSSAIPHISPEHFTLLLLNTSVSPAGSTHIFNHKCLRYRLSKFEALPMHIHNLGEVRPEYKFIPNVTGIAESFTTIVKCLKNEFQSSVPKETLVCEIQKALQTHLLGLIDEVESSEIETASLECDVLQEETILMADEPPLPELPQEGASERVPVPPLPSQSELQSAGGDDAPIRFEKPPCNPTVATSSAKQATKKEEESSSSDPFSYVADLKAEMSQPLTSTPGKESPALTTRRLAGRGRGSIRGGRKAPAPQQTQSTVAQKQQPSPKPAGDGDAVTTRRAGSAGASPVRSAAQLGSARGAKRGYAQAVKRNSVPSENPKPLTRSQAASSTGSQEN